MKHITLTFIAVIILSFITSAAAAYSQTIDTATVRITSVQAGDQTLEKS